MTTYGAEPRDAGLTAEELAGLREQLHEQRLFRLQQLEQLTGSVPAPQGAGGAATLPARAQVHLELTASARTVLAEVEAALRRMDRGDYGRCLRCGRPVALARLRVMPQTCRCADCHREEETGR